MKSVWITALAKEQVSVIAITGTASQYGLAADGHFWTDDLKNMAWMGIREKLCEKEIGLWVIAGKAEDLKPETCYGRVHASSQAVPPQPPPQPGVPSQTSPVPSPSASS